jgi:hypothetical protein
MKRTHAMALLVVGIALAVGSITLNLGVGFSSLGVVLAIFGCGVLLWDAAHPRQGG